MLLYLLYFEFNYRRFVDASLFIFCYKGCRTAARTPTHPCALLRTLTVSLWLLSAQYFVVI